MMERRRRRRRRRRRKEEVRRKRKVEGSTRMKKKKEEEAAVVPVVSRRIYEVKEEGGRKGFEEKIRVQSIFVSIYLFIYLLFVGICQQMKGLGN